MIIEGCIQCVQNNVTNCISFGVYYMLKNSRHENAYIQLGFLWTNIELYSLYPILLLCYENHIQLCIKI
jgi:hypothetical protein